MHLTCVASASYGCTVRRAAPCAEPHPSLWRLTRLVHRHRPQLCECTCVRARVGACVRGCVCAGVRVFVHTSRVSASECLIVLRRHLTEVGTGFLRVRGRARSSAMGGLDLTGFGIAEFSPQLNRLRTATCSALFRGGCR